jgi:hypothetical protein
MQTTIQRSHVRSAIKQDVSVSLWKRFITWCDSQEEYRLGWTAGIFFGHGCIFTIITVLAILFTGNHFIFWPFAILAIAAPLITNMAALPTRIVIPVFFASLVVDLLIIALCMANGFSVETVYP